MLIMIFNKVHTLSLSFFIMLRLLVKLVQFCNYNFNSKDTLVTETFARDSMQLEYEMMLKIKRAKNVCGLFYYASEWRTIKNNLCTVNTTDEYFENALSEY